jgi:Kdo2-lipid IVA lauroyltransferase/acyltransferase
MNQSPRPSPRLQHRIELALVRALTRGVSWLSRRSIRRIGCVFGWLAYHLLASRRRVALANLDIAFGDRKTLAEKQQITRASFQNVAGTTLGLLWQPSLTDAQVRALVRVSPAQAAWVTEIRDRGRGILFLTLHFGDWEFLSWAAAAHGFPLTVIARPLHNPLLDEFIHAQRSQSGQRLVPAKQAATKLFKTLKQGGSVALLIDQQVGEAEGGIWVPFFGLPACTTPAVAALALRTGAAIVFITGRTGMDGMTDIEVGPEIPCHSTGNTTADIRLITQQCVAACEQIIRNAPEQWLWSHKRWKNAPPGVAVGYPFYANPPLPASSGSNTR